MQLRFIAGAPGSQRRFIKIGVKAPRIHAVEISRAAEWRSLASYDGSASV